MKKRSLDCWSPALAASPPWPVSLLRTDLSIVDRLTNVGDDVDDALFLRTGVGGEEDANLGLHTSHAILRGEVS